MYLGGKISLNFEWLPGRVVSYNGCRAGSCPIMVAGQGCVLLWLPGRDVSYNGCWEGLCPIMVAGQGRVL